MSQWGRGDGQFVQVSDEVRLPAAAYEEIDGVIRETWEAGSPDAVPAGVRTGAGTVGVQSWAFGDVRTYSMTVLPPFGPGGTAFQGSGERGGRVGGAPRGTRDSTCASSSGFGSGAGSNKCLRRPRTQVEESSDSLDGPSRGHPRTQKSFVFLCSSIPYDRRSVKAQCGRGAFRKGSRSSQEHRTDLESR